MENIVITTESCSDLTKELMEQYHIYSVPMHIEFPTESYFDGELPVEKIYEYYKKTKQIPKTSAVNPSEFIDFFHTVAKENNNASIIHIGYSKEASSTFQNAVIALEECNDISVYLVDSQNVSGGLANLVLRAADIVSENKSETIETIVETINNEKKRIKTSFVPEHLEYLAAGGRVSNKAALGASLLRLKPRIDIVEGKLMATKKYRGTMSRVAGYFVEDFITGHELSLEVIYIIYALGAKDDTILQMKELLYQKGFRKIIVLKTGCVMSTHGGMGAIGLSGFIK